MTPDPWLVSYCRFCHMGWIKVDSFTFVCLWLRSFFYSRVPHKTTCSTWSWHFVGLCCTVKCFFFFSAKSFFVFEHLGSSEGNWWCFVDRGCVGLCCDWTGSMGFGGRDREEKGSSDWKSFWDCSIVEEYFQKMVRVIESEASYRSGCGLSCCSVSHILYLMLDFWPSFLLIHTLGAAMWETQMGFLVSGFHLTHPAWNVAGILGVSQQKECLSLSASQAGENK